LPSVQALKRADKSNLPYVVTIHGVFANRGLVINVAQKTYLHVISQVFKSADRIICLTESDMAEIVTFGFPIEKIRLVPNAVDTDRFRPLDEPTDNLIIWVGRFVPEKGLEYLLEAAKIVLNNFPDVRFLLIGYGPQKAKIMKLTLDCGLLGKSIFFSHSLSRNEIAKIMGKGTIFAFPSLKEGLPLSVLEAMACGLPVVGFDVSGVRDLVYHGETGFLVPPRNSKALAEAIMCLLNDKSLRRNLGRRARQLATEKYEWKTVLGALERVYREAIDESSSAIKKSLETQETSL
jgi:glycosyltransferase involved in cell wall biosynthesis